MIHTAPEVFAMGDARRYEQGGRRREPESKTPAIMEKNQMKPDESLEIR